MQTPTLQTDRLTLCPISMEHAPGIQRHINNWAVIRELSVTVPWPYPDDGAESFLQHVVLPGMKDGSKFVWALIPKEPLTEVDKNSCIGVIEYRAKDTGPTSDNRGFWLAEPYWGKGLMTEAVTAMQDWVFFCLGAEQMIVCNAKVNRRSSRVKEKTGAVLIGTRTLAHHHGNNECERWLITSASWAKHRNRTPVDPSC